VKVTSLNQIWDDLVWLTANRRAQILCLNLRQEFPVINQITKLFNHLNLLGESRYNMNGTLMAALQLLGIAGYCASLHAVHGCAGTTLALHHHKRTLHIVQLIFLG
jgi:hypothetical protein